jgi:hypothetical protein
MSSEEKSSHKKSKKSHEEHEEHEEHKEDKHKSQSKESEESKHKEKEKSRRGREREREEIRPSRGRRDRTKKSQEIEDEELAEEFAKQLEKDTTVVRLSPEGELASESEIEKEEKSERVFRIKEIDLKELEPRNKDCNDGVKYIFIGKPKSGKSKLLKAVMQAKNFIPVCQIYSGTEDSNKSFAANVPAVNIYNGLSNDDIKRFIRRQKLSMKHLNNPWGLLGIDDCFDRPSQFKDPLWLSIFKNSRHWKLVTLIAMQWCLDLQPSERSLIDYSFIFAEPSDSVRKRLWLNFGSVVGSFNNFCDVMTQATENYTSVVFKNLESSNKLEDRIGWYKANLDLVDSNWKFGHPLAWKFSDDRLNPDYQDPLTFY